MIRLSTSDKAAIKELAEHMAEKYVDSLGDFDLRVFEAVNDKMEKLALAKLKTIPGALDDEGHLTESGDLDYERVYDELTESPEFKALYKEIDAAVLDVFLKAFRIALAE